jgi:hypothetical protein
MRVFHIPTTQNFSYRGSIAQILYSDCQKISIKWSTLVVEYKNRKKEKFLYIAGRERKKLKALLANAPVQGQPSDTPERIHLCPRCTNSLIKDVFTCPHCSLEFKDRATARKISILYPGGGYFYTRHPLLGLGDALTELYLTFLVLVVLSSVIVGNTEAVPSLVIIGFILAFEKAITVFHSNNFINEFIPKDRKVQVFIDLPQSPPQQASPHHPTPEEILSASWRGR